jgi:hypothetical protein
MTPADLTTQTRPFTACHRDNASYQLKLLTREISVLKAFGKHNPLADVLNNLPLEHLKSQVRLYEVLTAVVVTVFWDVTTCRPLKVNRHFEGTRLLLLHGRRKRQ